MSCPAGKSVRVPQPRYTAEELDIIRRHYKDIALLQTLLPGRTLVSIMHKRKRMKLQIKNRVSIETIIGIICLKIANYSGTQIAAELDVSLETVKYYGTGLRTVQDAAGGKPSRSEEEQKRMLAAYETDACRKELAARFGYASADSMRCQVRKMRRGFIGRRAGRDG